MSKASPYSPEPSASPVRRRTVPWLLLRFSGVATIMAGIDISLLWLLSHGLEMALIPARLLSYGAALLAGFSLNQRFTFVCRQVALPLCRQITRFISVHVVGGTINLAVFALTLFLWEGGHGAQQTSFEVALLGVFLGGISGMAFNFTLSHQFVFAQR
jgi:putative flippase GtrA